MVAGKLTFRSRHLRCFRAKTLLPEFASAMIVTFGSDRTTHSSGPKACLIEYQPKSPVPNSRNLAIASVVDVSAGEAATSRHPEGMLWRVRHFRCCSVCQVESSGLVHSSALTFTNLAPHISSSRAWVQGRSTTLREDFSKTLRSFLVRRCAVARTMGVVIAH